MNSLVDGEMNYLTIRTCEMHTYGTPVRIIENGSPEIPGETILDKMTNLENSFVRKFVSFEPRGHHAISVFQVKPSKEEADVAILFCEKEGCLTMCGEAVISFGRYCLDKGIVKPKEPETTINIECPCGLVPISVEYNNGKAGRTRFRSVPSFVFATDIEINLEDVGRIKVDIAFGGGFYVLVAAQSLETELDDIVSLRKAARIGHAINEVVNRTINITHPNYDGIGYLNGTLVFDASRLSNDKVVKQIPVFRDSEGRGPCGSGTSALIATFVTRGKMEIGTSVSFKSAMSGVGFSAKATEETTCGKYKAFTIEVTGKGHYIGNRVMTSEPDDKLKDGFIGIA